MPRHYEYEERISSSRHDRDRDRDRDYSPDYQTGGSATGPRDSRDSFVRETMTLEPPPGYASSARPRSQPPPDSREVIPRGRSPSLAYEDDEDYYESRSRGYSRSRSRGKRHDDDEPLERARHLMQDNFTNSTAGIGASLIGAIAGGFAARQVSDRVSDHRSRDRRGPRRKSDADKDERIRLASTLIGAAIGGLGANAMTNRFEDAKEKTKEKEHAWENRHDDERRSIGGRRDSYDDDDYDYVYDREDDRRRSRRRDSGEDYRRY